MPGLKEGDSPFLQIRETILSNHTAEFLEIRSHYMKVVDTDYNNYALVYAETEFTEMVLFSFYLYGASSLHPLRYFLTGHIWKWGPYCPKPQHFLHYMPQSGRRSLHKLSMGKVSGPHSLNIIYGVSQARGLMPAIETLGGLKEESVSLRSHS